MIKMSTVNPRCKSVVLESCVKATKTGPLFMRHRLGLTQNSRTTDKIMAHIMKLLNKYFCISLLYE